MESDHKNEGARDMGHGSKLKFWYIWRRSGKIRKQINL
jgi:hypothetical protein